MRILLVTQFFEPEPHDQFSDLARWLVARGHEVQVITGFPCYPLGQAYPGWRQRLYEERIVDGVLVTRLPQFPDHSRSALRRALYYLSFMLSAATIGLWRSRKADVVLVYQAALPASVAGWWISRLQRARLALHVVDLWPESIAASGILRQRHVLNVIRRVARWLYGAADAISVITVGYRDNLSKMGVSAEKMRVVYCWAKQQLLTAHVTSDIHCRTSVTDAPLKVAYAGAIGACQGLEVVLDAAEILGRDQSCEFTIAGDGTELARLQQLASKRRLSNVRFLGRVFATEVPAILADADALLVHLVPDAMSSVSIPSKTWEYLAAGRPLLMAVDGEAGSLAEQHEFGLAVPPSDGAALAEAIRRLRTNADLRDRLTAGARRASSHTFNATSQMAALEQMLLDQLGVFLVA